MNKDVITMLLMLVIFALFYATVVMPQKKRERQVQEIQNALKVGDDIVTFAGIIGKIINVSNDTLTIETGPEKTKMNIYKWAVKELVPTKSK